MGFERVAAAPEFSYVLGFSPTALKADGSFHSFKIRLPNVTSLHVQKTDGRSRDSLTVVSALFDLDGGYVMGTAKTVNLRLREGTLAHMVARSRRGRSSR